MKRKKKKKLQEDVVNKTTKLDNFLTKKTTPVLTKQEQNSEIFTSENNELNKSNESSKETDTCEDKIGALNSDFQNVETMSPTVRHEKGMIFKIGCLLVSKSKFFYHFIRFFRN